MRLDLCQDIECPQSEGKPQLLPTCIIACHLFYLALDIL